MKNIFFACCSFFCLTLTGVSNSKIIKNNETLVQQTECKQRLSINEKRSYEYNTDKESVISDSSENIEQINEVILKCENNLQIKGNSVKNELIEQIKTYQKKLFSLENSKNQNSDQIQNIKTLIEDLELMLDQYQSYKNYNVDEGLKAKAIQPASVAVNPDNLLSLSYPAAHAAIVSYFSDCGYILSAELLTHMKSNAVYDSIYKPVNSDIVYNNESFKNLSRSSQLQGSGAFNSGDLYMAIHAFDYSKSVKNTAIVLTDRYDFEFDASYDDFLTQSAVNMMASAQNSGFLTPYYVVVEYSNNINLNNNSNVKSFPMSNWRYSETMATLGKGENAIYTISFSTKGYRNIQTFGYNDSYISIQSSSGTTLISNDDGGYERNAFINYYFSTGQTYRIVVRFYSSSIIGNVRVAITPSSYDKYDNINSLERTWGLFKTAYKDVEINNNAGQVSMFLLKPALSSSFTIQTTKKSNYVDTYLLYIDPRRADEDRYKNKDITLKSCIENDDGADNRQAKLSIERHDCNTPYLIIAGTFSSSATGAYYLDINGLDSSHFLIF